MYQFKYYHGLINEIANDLKLEQNITFLNEIIIDVERINNYYDRLDELESMCDYMRDFLENKFLIIEYKNEIIHKIYIYSPYNFCNTKKGENLNFTYIKIKDCYNETKELSSIFTNCSNNAINYFINNLYIVNNINYQNDEILNLFLNNSLIKINL